MKILSLKFLGLSQVFLLQQNIEHFTDNIALLSKIEMHVWIFIKCVYIHYYIV